MPTTERLDSLNLPDETTIVVDWGTMGGDVLSALEWIAGAAGAGIVGNAAYDAIKAKISRKSRKESLNDPVEDILAKTAIRHQFSKLSWTLSEDAVLQVKEKREAERNGDEVWVMVIECEDPEFTSTVIVPKPDLKSLGISVAIRRPNGGR